MTSERSAVERTSFLPLFPKTSATKQVMYDSFYCLPAGTFNY